MKMRRVIWFGWLAGAGLMLALAIAHWHPGQRAPALQPDRSLAGLASEVALPETSPVIAEQSSQPLAVTLTPQPSPDPFLRNLASALGSLQTDTDRSSRDQKLEVLANEMAQTNLPVALEFLKTRNAFGPGRDLSDRLVRRWAELDAKGAAAWVTENLMGTVREEAINGVAIVWANQDLAGATAWMRQLPEDDRESGLLSIAYEAARTEPVAALNLAAELPADQSREDLVVHAARQWASQDAQGAGTR